MRKQKKERLRKRKRRIRRLKRLSLFTVILIIIIVIIKINKKTVDTTTDIANFENNNSEIEEEKAEIDSKTTDWELLLVNKNNKLSDDYEVNLELVENTSHQVDSRILESLLQMLNDARESGLSPLICSSYRSNSTQIILYENKVQEFLSQGYTRTSAENYASYWVTIPGTSEHGTGLAVDIVDLNYQLLDEEQENTDVQKWLIENSYKYGFVLRYPTDKREITNINYEPWHYRYVGVENATFMKEKGYCLEEYIEYLKKFE